MQNRTIIDKIYKNSTTNHFFFSEDEGFFKAFLKHKRNKEESEFFDIKTLHMREIIVKEKIQTANDIVGEILKCVWTSINSDDVNEAILEIAKIFGERCVRTDYLYVKNADRIFTFDDEEKDKTLSYLQTIASLSGTRFIFIGDISLYKNLKKYKSFFSPFSFHGLGASEIKKYIKDSGSKKRCETSIPLLGSIGAVVKTKKIKSLHDTIIEVLPVDNTLGQYVSLDKEIGILFWSIEELLFTKQFSSNELKSSIEVLKDEDASIYVVCDDNRRIFISGGWEKDDSFYFEEYATFLDNDTFGGTTIKNENGFVDDLGKIFSIAILKGDTSSRYQNLRDEISPLVCIKTPENDTFYQFITLYKIKNTNAIYLDIEGMLKHDLETEDIKPEEIEERILSDIKNGTFAISKDNEMIMENTGHGFVSRSKIEKLHIITPPEKSEEYIKQFTNLEKTNGKYEKTQHLETMFRDDIEFVVADNTAIDTVKSMDGYEMIPFGYFVSAKDVKTKDIVKTHTTTIISKD